MSMMSYPTTKEHPGLLAVCMTHECITDVTILYYGGDLVPVILGKIIFLYRIYKHLQEDYS